jgi:hypothetical protein
MADSTVTMDAVRRSTEAFFNMHWACACERPKWGEIWTFTGVYEDLRKPGCYAVLSGDAVLYLGVGASVHDGSDRDGGLGRRMKRFWRQSPGKKTGQYEPVQKWDGHHITGLCTIGFHHRHAYLANALELYLLAKHCPPCNQSNPVKIKRQGNMCHQDWKCSGNSQV